MIEFDYRQEHLRTGEIICRPVAKVYIPLMEAKGFIKESTYNMIPSFYLFTFLS